MLDVGGRNADGKGYIAKVERLLKTKPRIRLPRQRKRTSPSISGIGGTFAQVGSWVRAVRGATVTQSPGRTQ